MSFKDLPLQERGVYYATCLSPEGFPILYAVDRHHRHLSIEQGGVVTLFPGDNPFQVNQQLWDLLNQVDPLLRISDVA